MKLGCFSSMVSCVMGMSIRCMCVMSRRFVLAGFVMPGGMAVMFRRALVMRGCLVVVLSSLFRHGFLLVPVGRSNVLHASSPVLLAYDRSVKPPHTLCGKPMPTAGLWL
jgi:hypothetical protein